MSSRITNLKRKHLIIVMGIGFLSATCILTHGANGSFTEKDRERLIRMEERLDAMQKEFNAPF